MNRILHIIKNNIIIVIFIVSGIFTNIFAQDVKVLKGTIEVVKMYDDEEVYAVLKVISNLEDDEGKIVTSIEEYPIEDNIAGKRLYQLDGETVEARGTVFEDNYGPVWFTVHSFKIIKPKQDENEKEDNP
jgi:hypothetical protein